MERRTQGIAETPQRDSEAVRSMFITQRKHAEFLGYKRILH